MTMYSQKIKNHQPTIKVNGGPLLDEQNAKKVRYTLRPNPDSDSQERQRLKRLVTLENRSNRTLNICATLQCFFTSCLLAIGLYLTIAKAWGYKSGVNFIAAFFVLICGLAGYRAARTKARTAVRINCILAWSVFALVYIPMFLIGLLGAFLSLHHPYLDDFQFPKDEMTLAVHGSNSIISMLGFLVSLIQATIKTNSRVIHSHYTKTVSPVVLTVSQYRPSPSPVTATTVNHTPDLHNHTNHQDPVATTSSRRNTITARGDPIGGASSSCLTCSDIITRV